MICFHEGWVVLKAHLIAVDHFEGSWTHSKKKNYTISGTKKPLSQTCSTLAPMHQLPLPPSPIAYHPNARFAIFLQPHYMACPSKSHNAISSKPQKITSHRNSLLCISKCRALSFPQRRQQKRSHSHSVGWRLLRMVSVNGIWRSRWYPFRSSSSPFHEAEWDRMWCHWCGMCHSIWRIDITMRCTTTSIGNTHIAHHGQKELRTMYT